MKDVNWLKENYLSFLEGKEEKLKRRIEDLQKQECIDEANLQKIRLNIVEIFHSMFNISLGNNPELLREKYLGFFDKITGPWKINKEKAIKFNNDMEAIIEDIKIKEAEELEKQFKDYYRQLDIC